MTKHSVQLELPTMKKSSILSVLFLLVSPISSFEIECFFNTRYWTHANFIYTCEAKITQNENLTTIDVISGNHAQGKTNADVVGIIFQNQSLTHFPQNLAMFFPELVGFISVSSSLTKIEAGDLEPFPELMFLRLWGNQIVTLDRDLFQFSPNLRFIDFKLNLLEHVGTDLLGNLPRLQEADFRLNPCVDVYVDYEADIRELNRLLPTKCPPLNEPPTTTELPQCKLRCSLEDEVDVLKYQLTNQIEVNERQSEAISSLENVAAELKSLSAKQEERIEDLERRIDEIIT